MEKRRDDRYDLLMPIRLRPNERTEQEHAFVAQTCNISSAGALIRTPRILPVGTELDIELYLNVPQILGEASGQCRVVVRLEGTVVRNHDDGMAVRFADGFRFVTS